MENENQNPAPQAEAGQAQEAQGQEQTQTGNPGGTPPAGEPQSNPTEAKPEEGAAKAKPEGQSKEEDAKFAKMRHERDMAKAKAAGDAEGYKRARIKSVGGTNPYTETPIETDEDYELYELQDEVKSKGGDPKNVFEVDRLRREKAQEAAKAAEDAKSEEQRMSEAADREVADYLKEGHTKADLMAYWADQRFQEFASDLLGKVPLKTIIAKFDRAYPKEDPGRKLEAAKKISNPGSSTPTEEPPQQKSISDMSRDEFKSYLEKVKSGKVHI